MPLRTNLFSITENAAEAMRTEWQFAYFLKKTEASTSERKTYETTDLITIMDDKFTSQGNIFQ